ncbi:MAG: polysaccharide biosynthesis tyrosine autokinase [Candidatus Marinimicrobia bacterium]|nr:polysaccharide biosynthesis tyrosine autokinase [Candidatus Neomarinimicrobiota bacterium]
MNGDNLNIKSQNGFDEKEISLRDYISVLYRNRWIIITIILIVLAATVYFTFTAPPQYEAKALVMLVSPQGQATLFTSPFMPSQYLKVNNEVEVLKSFALGRRVIKSLKNSPYSDSLYLLETRELKTPGLNIMERLAGLKDAVKRIFGAGEELAEEDTLDRYFVKKLHESMKIEPIRETEAIRIIVRSFDPVEASLIANTIAQEYYEMDLEFNRSEVVETKNFLEEQLKKVERDLQRAEERLKEFQEKQGVFALEEAAKTLIDQMTSIEAEYYATVAQVQALRKKLDNQQRLLNEREKWIVQEAINISNPLIEQLKKVIAEVEAEKAAAIVTHGYEPNSDVIREYDKRINQLKEKLVAEAQRMTNYGITTEDQSKISMELVRDVFFNQVALIELETKSKEYKNMVDRYNKEFNKLPEKSLMYARLDRERQVNDKLYMLLKTKYQESRITEASKMSNVRIVDPAIPPEKPVKPNKKLNLILGLLVGVFLGVGFAFVREYFDRSIKTAEELQNYGLSAIGIVPEIDVRTALDKFQKVSQDYESGESLKARLVTHYDPKSSVAESYRTLRTNIQFSSPDKPVQTMIVSSSGPGEGKSTTAANLAITFANLGRKTILIDSDLRKPILHKVFGISKEPGIAHAILDMVPLNNVISETEIDNLYLVPCGETPPNPSELLASNRMLVILEELKKTYDIIIFDTPPVIAVTDATVLAKITDGIVLVVRANKTDSAALQRTMELLSHVNCNVIGAVLNEVSVSAGYGSYYYYYYHYYGDGGKKKKRKKKTGSELTRNIFRSKIR